jgi:acetyl-CoA acyltransferase
MREAVIVAGVRTAIGRAGKGTLKNTRPDDLGALVVREVLQRISLDPALVDDVIIGNATPEAEQGMNVARMISLLAGLPTSAGAQTVNRFCSSGLQAIAIGAQQVMTGTSEIVVAGGVESMSMIPMGGHTIRPNMKLMETIPAAYMPMGMTAEQVAKRFQITREEQDAFALRSHQRASAAREAGRFQEEIVPVPVKEKTEDGQVREFLFDQDECIRPETTMEALASLRTVFDPNGSVTAGNSSPMNDGAAAVVVMSREKAEELGLRPRLVFRSFAVAGVDPDIMGVGPVEAVPKALRIAGLKQDEVDLFELNEAFASQAVYCIRKLELDESKVNVNGGAIALGHPLGCTGTRQTVTLMHEMERRGARYGVVTMCIGGGMGAAGVFERV